MNSIGIIVIATNSYFILGIRFIKRFAHFYKGNAKVKFYFFSDTDPKEYLPDNIDIQYYHRKHEAWADATNSKFSNILSIQSELLKNTQYAYYFDADTNINCTFTEDWFIGDMVGGEHWMSKQMDPKGYDRNPDSRAYVPETTLLPQIYFYGAFFGGKTENMIDFSMKLFQNQNADKAINYEPTVNDESYINQHFHFYPPSRIIPCTEFGFIISDKGGIEEMRCTYRDISEYKRILKDNKDRIVNIADNQIIIT